MKDLSNTLENKFRCNRKNGREIYGHRCNENSELCYEYYCPNHTCNNCLYYENYMKECHMKCTDFMNHPYYRIHYRGKDIDPMPHMIIDQNIDKAVKKIMANTVKGFQEDGK